MRKSTSQSSWNPLLFPQLFPVENDSIWHALDISLDFRPSECSPDVCIRSSLLEVHTYPVDEARRRVDVSEGQFVLSDSFEALKSRQIVGIEGSLEILRAAVVPKYDSGSTVCCSNAAHSSNRRRGIT
jgi:hypothetical protein